MGRYWGQVQNCEEGRGLTKGYQPKGKYGGITLEILSSLSLLLRGRIASGHCHVEIDERLANIKLI